MELAKKSPVFEKAVDVLSAVSADDYNRMLYEARLKEWRDNKSRIDGAWAFSLVLLRRVKPLWKPQGLSLRSGHFGHKR